MKEKYSTAIRLEDRELLRNLAKFKGWPATEILHRSLSLFLLSIPDSEIDDKVLLELRASYARQPAQSATSRASANLVKVIRTALETEPHETLITKASPRELAKTRKRN